MDLNEFLASLDANNPFFLEFKELLETSLCRDLVAYRKGHDLIDRVISLNQRSLYPLVDQKTSLVIGLPDGQHEMMRAWMYTYHDAYQNPDAGVPRIDMGAEWYMTDGMGWYISSMQPGVIVTSVTYNPDRYDTPIFKMFKLAE